MGIARRTVLVGTAVALAGCSGVSNGDGSTTDGRPPETTDGGDTETPTPPPGCDPADVARPAVPTDAAVGGQSYPEVPAELTTQSVMEYLADFETAYAWNRAVGARDDVTSINVDTLDGFTPEAVDDGFLASSRMRVMFTVGQEGENPRTERTDYVANYYVGDEVFRLETADARVDPRDEADTVLVACAGDAEK